MHNRSPLPAPHLWTRRRFFGSVAATTAAVGLITPDVFAQELLTPSSTEGPFYPDKYPLDTDNDLMVINDAINPAVGTVAYLSGRILDRRGNPVPHALVEIWQCDSNGVYIHSRGGDRAKMDGNFQGFGRFLATRKGEYYFRTIKPVKYAGRTPHIHTKVWVRGREILTTQCYNKGDAQNDRDFLFGKVKAKRNLVEVEWKPIKDSKIGAVEGTWDIRLGWTPTDG